MAKKEAVPEEVEDDVDLEDMEVSFDEAESEEETSEETSEEASAEETKEESTDDAETETEEDESEKEEADKEETGEESDDESKDKSEDESGDESKAEESDKDTQMSDEERKQHNREMAEKRIQEKKEKEETLRREQKEFIADAPDETALALRQLQVDAYNTKVETNEGRLENSYDKALNDFPILTDETPEIEAELKQAIDTFLALNVSIDEYGNPTEVRGDLYSFLKTKAESIERLTKIGAKNEAKAKSKSKANTLTPPSRTPKEPKKDEMLEGFDEEINRY